VADADVVAAREADAVGVFVPVPVPDGAEALAEADACADEVPVPAPLPEAVVVARALVEAGALAVPLNKPDGVAVAVGPALTDGEKIAGTDEVPPVQAVTDAEKTTVAVAQPAAVSLALLTFMRPPYTPGMQRPRIHSPQAQHPRLSSPRPRTSNLHSPWRSRQRSKRRSRQWRVFHFDIRLREWSAVR